MTADDVTGLVFVASVATWLPLELWRLVQRLRWKPEDGPKPPSLISTVNKKYGWRATGVVYFLTSCPFHWWAPTPRWGGTASGVTYWSLLVALLAWDAVRWKATGRERLLWPVWERWARWPPVWMATGALVASFLFPQAQDFPWSP